ncbi:MAG TPA: hypothetical protein VNL17_14415 [Verrucomicrobiae bacterium]|nr:hypothetical protein [Verrucomicrobiae bacterium]
MALWADLNQVTANAAYWSNLGGGKWGIKYQWFNDFLNYLDNGWIADQNAGGKNLSNLAQLAFNGSGFINSSLGVGVVPTQLGHFRKNQNTNTIVLCENQTAGTAAQANFRALNDAGRLGQFGVFSSATTPYGAIAANDAFLYATSSVTLMADIAGGVVKFACNGNGEFGRFDSNGAFRLSAIAIPGTPAAATFYIFIDSADNKLKCKGPSGTVTTLGNP